MTDQQQSSSKFRQAKRFIAGAVCPQCQVLDRLVLITDDSVEPPQLVRRCVACNFSEVLEQAPSYSLPNSIKDRNVSGDDPGQIVRILEP